MSRLTLASDGVVVAPDFHDARLVGVFFPSDRRVLLVIRDIHDIVHCLALNGVERFRTDDIREGNIILDITIESGTVVNAEDISYVFGLVSNPTYENLVTKTIARFKTGELLLVKLNPSYGGSLICVCTSAEIAPTWFTELENSFTDKAE